MRHIGYLIPAGLNQDNGEHDMVLPAHGLHWTTHVDHDRCLPLYADDGSGPAASAHPSPGELLTPAELRAMDLTGQLGAVLSEIIGDGPAARADWRELVDHIHVIQNAILAQAAARAYPRRFRLMGSTVDTT